MVEECVPDSLNMINRALTEMFEENIETNIDGR